MTDDLLFDIGEPIGTSVMEQPQEVQKPPVRDFDLWVPLPFAPLTGAAFSPCRTYRYMLWRQFLERGETVLFVLLNPSTADEIKNDPTITRLEGYAKAWGFARLVVVNLFAYRATMPSDLKFAPEPVGPDNDEWIVRMASKSKLVICGWGNHGKYMKRNHAVLDLLKNAGHGDKLHCLKKNKDGSYGHPLYLRADLKPMEI